MSNKYDFYDLEKVEELAGRPETIEIDGYYWDPTDLPPKDYLDEHVPLEFKNIGKWMRSKMNGLQTRETMARLAEMVGINTRKAVDVVEENKVRQDTLEEQFDAIQRDSTGKDVVSSMEIVAARGGKATLGQRLDETTAQLAQKATKTEVAALDTKINSQASGSPKGTYATLTALQTAYPTGNANIYVVTADGNWYYWNDSAWVSGGVYQATSLPKEVVNVADAFEKEILRADILAETSWEYGTLWEYDGRFIADSTRENLTSAFIKVEKGTSLQFPADKSATTKGYRFCEYDENLAFIRKVNSLVGESEFNLLKETKYIRVTIDALFEGLETCSASKLSIDISRIKNIDVDEINAVTSLVSKRTTDLFLDATWEYGYLASDGYYRPSPGNETMITGFIPVSGGKKIEFPADKSITTKGYSVGEYDEERTLLRFTKLRDRSVELKLLDDTKSIRVDIDSFFSGEETCLSTEYLFDVNKWSEGEVEKAKNVSGLFKTKVVDFLSGVTWEYGYISNVGSFVSDSTLENSTSGFIRVVGGAKITFPTDKTATTKGYKVSEYDGNRVFIGKEIMPINKNEVTLEKETRFVRVSIDSIFLGTEEGIYEDPTLKISGDNVDLDGLEHIVTSIDGKQYKLQLDSDGEIIAERLESELEDFLDGRVLVWHDEFDGKVLDAEKWGHEYGGPRIRQWYPVDTNRNSYIEDGKLVLKAFREQPHPNYEWSGASLITNNKFEFRYGRIEAKIKYDSTPGTYCTLWTMGANYDRIFDVENDTNDETIGVPWPMNGEIDIAEYTGRDTSTNIHWSNTADLVAQSGHTSIGLGGHGGDATKWRIFAMEWTPDALEFYVDGVHKGTFNIDDATVGDYNPFRLPHFIILNHGIGSDTLGVKPADNVNELTTMVDWIRVYAPKDAQEVVTENDISLDYEDITLSVGQEQVLNVTFTPDNTADKTLVWKSHNMDVVTAYGGKLSAKSLGVTLVTVTSKYGKRATCRVVVS